MFLRAFMILTFAGGIYYLSRSRTPPPRTVPLPPAPPAIGMEPLPAFNDAEIQRVRDATKDGNPNVRWAAIELLHKIHDPQANEILENMLEMDTEVSVRRNALQILRRNPKPQALKDLLIALKDQEKDIRIQAVLALGEIGDSKVASYIGELLMDIDPDVRLQALLALGRIQENKEAAHRDLANQLKAQYEAAVRRAKEKGAKVPDAPLPPPAR